MLAQSGHAGRVERRLIFFALKKPNTQDFALQKPTPPPPRKGQRVFKKFKKYRKKALSPCTPLIRDPFPSTKCSEIVF